MRPFERRRVQGWSSWIAGGGRAKDHIRRRISAGNDGKRGYVLSSLLVRVLRRIEDRGEEVRPGWVRFDIVGIRLEFSC